MNAGGFVISQIKNIIILTKTATNELKTEPNNC